GTIERAGVPSGASTGQFEAVELRDGGDRYGGKGVTKAVTAVNDEVADEVVGHAPDGQRLIDRALIGLDGTPGRSRVGATAILGAPLPVATAAAAERGLWFFRYIGRPHSPVLHEPMFNPLHGGAHADTCVHIPAFMVAPMGAPAYAEGLRWAT